MATFYVGYRPVLRSRNSNDHVHHWRGEVGTYSHYALMSSSHVLSGAPDNKKVPGEERGYNYVRLLEYIYAGGQHIAPMVGAGDGPRWEGGRFRPLEYKGLPSAVIFSGDYGFTGPPTESARYSNLAFDGLAVTEALLGAGTPRRFNVSFGGAFDPFIYKGASERAMEDPGQPLPVGYDNPYGKNKINEWRGIPSAKAL